MVQETKDWELNPHLYSQDSEGNFLLKKDGTPKKKAGRQRTSTEKAIKAARSTISRKQRNIQKLEQKLNNAKTSFKKQKETISNEKIISRKIIRFLINLLFLIKFIISKIDKLFFVVIEETSTWTHKNNFARN